MKSEEFLLEMRVRKAKARIRLMRANRNLIRAQFKEASLRNRIDRLLAHEELALATQHRTSEII